MTRRVSRFFRGQSIRDLRLPLNRLVEQVNAGNIEGYASQANQDFVGERHLVLEIKMLNPSDLICVLPTLAAEPLAFQYTVSLPDIFTEASRGGVNYTYTDINNRQADGSENQQLTPEFVVGENIHCVFIDDNTQGYWLFVGDGRMWAKV